MNEKQLAIADEFGNKAYDDEIAYHREHNPDRLDKTSQTDLDSYRDKVVGMWREVAADFCNHESLFDRVKRGALHPSNKLWRAMFTRLTGVALPGTVSGTLNGVKSYIGEAEFNRMALERDSARQAEVDAREAKEKANADAKFQAIIDGAVVRMQAGESVDGETLVTVCRHLGIDVHPRTVGMLRTRVRQINAESARIIGRGIGSTPYDLYRQCVERIAAGVVVH